MLSGRVLERKELPLPTSFGQRVKLTCIDVVKNRLVVGATTGSVYFYRVTTSLELAFLKMISLNSNRSSIQAQDAITHVKINPSSPDVFAISTVGGVIFIVDGKIATLKQKERVLQKINDHKSWITEMEWDAHGQYLVSGDSEGWVRRTQYKKSSSYFSSSSDVVVKCGSPIVQLCIKGEFLLCSTTKTTVLIEEFARPKPTIHRVGTKQRDGQYGGCFVLNSDGKLIYAARPKKRIWKATSINGQVQSTFKMKLPPPSWFDPFSLLLPQSAPRPPASQINFSKLYNWQNGIVSFGGSVILLVDTTNVKIVEWYTQDELGKIFDLALTHDKIFLLQTKDKSLQTLQEGKEQLLGTEKKVSVVMAVPPTKLFRSLAKPFQNVAKTQSDVPKKLDLPSPGEMKRIQLHLDRCVRASRPWQTETDIDELKDIAQQLIQELIGEDYIGPGYISMKCSNSRRIALIKRLENMLRDPSVPSDKWSNKTRSEGKNTITGVTSDPNRNNPGGKGFLTTFGFGSVFGSQPQEGEPAVLETLSETIPFPQAELGEGIMTLAVFTNKDKQDHQKSTTTDIVLPSQRSAFGTTTPERVGNLNIKTLQDLLNAPSTAVNFVAPPPPAPIQTKKKKNQKI